MTHYIIDGNNLIGKIPALMKIQKKDKQSSREKLALMLQRYFLNKKANVTLHLDGFAVTKINAGRIKIIYSENITADEKIKNQIEKSKSPRTITVITSDSNLTQFAKVCSCKVIPSEDFAKQLNNKSQDDEQTIIDSMKNDDEFKKLFGV
ncbi:MAG TPA: NYN domain-containing protein [Ignavibacteriaceae bacterium]|nr:NYN domain-containing protein [Ignavibacteriaceae bacterium]HQJ46103.1 NYN domain-containing protein [Ignavibacteriaceae bacterium]